MIRIKFHKALLLKVVLVNILFLSGFYTYSQTEKLMSSLDYINDQFKKYNPYKLQFQLDVENKNLISKSVYFEVSYPINQLNSITFTKRADNDCIIYFKCSNDAECISAYNLDDKETDLKPEYSFNLETTPEIAEKVVIEFLSIKNALANTKSNVSVSKNVTIPEELNADIDYINKMLKKYNLYEIQFSIDWNKKLLQSSSILYQLTYDPTILKPVDLITRGLNDYKINFECKTGDPCLKSIDLRDNTIEMKSNYSVNFTGNADEVQKAIWLFNYIFKNLNN
jgi:hypothetical protein